MKKALFVFLGLTAVVLVMSCATSDGKAKTTTTTTTTTVTTTTTPNAGTPAQASAMPAWVAELSPEDAYWGIGMAKLTNQALAQETATTRASREIARQISQLVQGLLTDYAREAGLVDNAVSIMHIENIGRNLVNANLTGARINARELMPDGTWWVRASVTNGEIKNVVNAIYDNEAASFAEWKKDQALGRLDAMLAVPAQPTVRSED